jgi:septum site-determining protein MinC
MGGLKMSVEVTPEGRGAELVINLKAWGSFADMKAELERNLTTIDSYLMGSMVSIDVGNKSITERQLREMEDILLEHGFHMRELINGEDPRSDPGRLRFYQGFDEADNQISNNTTLIYRSLRSGQRYRSEGNMVVLGDINPGAEVIAGGNILVMGALKGIAHAGAYGDESAVIAAFRLNPIQLRIANHITRPPDGENIVINAPELAKIRAGKVVIEKLKI